MQVISCPGSPRASKFAYFYPDLSHKGESQGSPIADNAMRLFKFLQMYFSSASWYSRSWCWRPGLSLWVGNKNSLTLHWPPTWQCKSLVHKTIWALPAQWKPGWSCPAMQHWWFGSGRAHSWVGSLSHSNWQHVCQGIIMLEHHSHLHYLPRL